MKLNLFTRLFKPLIRRSLYDLYPDLLDRQPLLRINSEEESASVANPFTQNAGSYTNYMWLQKAVKVLADNIAPLPLRVARGPQDDSVYVDNHPIVSLLDNPNPEMSPEDLWKQWVTDQMLGGEMGLEAVRNGGRSKLLELWPRQPQQFTVRPASARYRKVAYYKVDDGYDEPYQLAPEDFIHFKFYNPLSPFRGLAPVTAIRLSITIDQLAQAWTRLFFKNQARPDYAVIAPEGITPTEKKEILTQLSIDYGGGTGIHKPIVLEEGVTDIKTFSWAPKDMEWINQRQMSRDEVAAIIGVPDEIMGYGRDTYENFATAEKVLWTLTIVPLCGLRDGTLTRYFRKVGLLKANERIETNFTNVPQLQEDKTGKIDQMGKLFSMGVPVNVASDYVNAGLPPVEGGDTGYLPISLIPVGTSLEVRQPAPVTEPAPAEDEPAPAEEELAPTEEPVKAQRKAVEYGSADHIDVYKRLQARIDGPVSSLKRIVKKEFQRQQNEINKKLREGKTFGKGHFKDSDNVPSPEELFNLAEEVKKFINAFEEPVFNLVETIGSAELSALGISGVFDLDRPEVQAAVKHILSTVAQKTNNTTWEGLIELFREAELAGEGIPAIQERLSAFFGDRKSDYQTERIARTTMTGASNEGSFEAWRQSNVVRGKMWISALQADRTRESHAAAHGQVVGLNETFTVDGENLQFPGDPLGSPGNIINCLCGMTAVVEE